MKKPATLFLALLFLNACSTSYGRLTAPRPSDNPPPSTVRQLSTQGEFTAEVYQQDDVGSMSPLYVILRNETGSPRIISLSGIHAVNSTGAKVLSIPAEEAARQAGEAGSAPGMWKGAAKGAGVGAAIGSVAGSLIGLVLGGGIGAARGAIIGGASMGGVGAASGAARGEVAGTLNAQAQVLNIHLKDQILMPGSQVSGYLFFGKDSYKELRLITGSDEEWQQEVIVPVQLQKTDHPAEPEP